MTIGAVGLCPCQKRLKEHFSFPLKNIQFSLCECARSQPLNQTQLSFSLSLSCSVHKRGAQADSWPHSGSIISCSETGKRQRQQQRVVEETLWRWTCARAKMAVRDASIAISSVLRSSQTATVEEFGCVYNGSRGVLSKCKDQCASRFWAPFLQRFQNIPKNNEQPVSEITRQTCPESNYLCNYIILCLFLLLLRPSATGKRAHIQILRKVRNWMNRLDACVAASCSHVCVCRSVARAVSAVFQVTHPSVDLHWV